MPTLEATITRANGHGFRIADQDGWLNVSKYADPADVALPAVGSRVLLTLDAQGFVRRIGPAGDTPATDGAPVPTSGPTGRPGRERTITRLAVLNTAATVLASGGRATDPAELLDLAAQLEGWATR